MHAVGLPSIIGRAKHVVVDVEGDALKLVGLVLLQIAHVMARTQQALFLGAPPRKAHPVLGLQTEGRPAEVEASAMAPPSDERKGTKERDRDRQTE